MRVEAGNLHKDAVATLRGDDRFADAELVDAFADDFDGLIEGGRGDFFTVFADETEEERCAPLQVETEADFFLRRDDRLKAEREKEQGQGKSDIALAARCVGHEIPREQAEQEQAENEGEGRAHGRSRRAWRWVRRLPPWSRK